MPLSWMKCRKIKTGTIMAIATMTDIKVPFPQTSAPAPSKNALTKPRMVPNASNQSGAFHGRLTWALLISVNPTGVQIEEVEHNVADVGDGKHARRRRRHVCGPNQKYAAKDGTKRTHSMGNRDVSYDPIRCALLTPGQ